MRSMAYFLGLAGWVMLEHWTLVPAVIIWTLAGLFFLGSFTESGQLYATAKDAKDLKERIHKLESILSEVLRRT